MALKIRNRHIGWIWLSACLLLHCDARSVETTSVSPQNLVSTQPSASTQGVSRQPVSIQKQTPSQQTIKPIKKPVTPPIVVRRKTSPVIKRRVASVVKTRPWLNWRYDAKACESKINKAEKQVNDPISIVGDDLMAQASALNAPAKTCLGAFNSEIGDGCRNYESSLLYRFQRATRPKYTKHFIHYHRKPQWVVDYFASTYRTWPVSYKMTALYRGPFIVYEVNYGTADSSMKRLYRQIIKSCFEKVVDR